MPAAKHWTPVLALLHLRLPVATGVRDSRELEVWVGELIAGDIVIVKTGCQIASDGIVLDSPVTVNESAITGGVGVGHKVCGRRRPRRYRLYLREF